MERLVRIIAGSFILPSLGANLLQSGFTRWCLMEDILEWLGVAAPRTGPECHGSPRA